MSVASKTERNQVLDELVTATEQWRDHRKRRLTEQVDLAKRILKGRTGSQRLQNEMVQQASSLLVDEVEAFLTGSR